MKYIKEQDIWVWAECSECGMTMKFRKEDLKLDESTKTYHLKEGVECFCGEQSCDIEEVPEKKNVKAVQSKINEPSYSVPVRNIPRCPTCGSPNVTKISLGAKAVGGAMFGIFSSNVRKSYKCNNCGYKW